MVEVSYLGTTFDILAPHSNLQDVPTSMMLRPCQKEMELQIFASALVTSYDNLQCNWLHRARDKANNLLLLESEPNVVAIYLKPNE